MLNKFFIIIRNLSENFRENIIFKKNMSKNCSNYTCSSYVNCSTPQTLAMNNIFECYSYFFEFNKHAALLQVILVIGVLFFNSLLILNILSNSNTASVTVFEKILVGHSIVDGIDLIALE